MKDDTIECFFSFVRDVQAAAVIACGMERISKVQLIAEKHQWFGEVHHFAGRTELLILANGADPCW